ncbi:MAG: hypothetical protein HY252_07910 [Sphingobacteriales bacterium]|nr:hypothetical protein [Sphingobacteriales bacterium]
MKAFFASALFLLSFGLQAQLSFTDSVNISRERWRDSMFRMDKNQIPTGFLTEYSMGPFEITKHDGLNNDDDTTKNYADLLMLHNILQESKVNATAVLNPTDSIYQWAYNSYTSNQSIPFIILSK